jgi:hypothetical protein
MEPVHEIASTGLIAISKVSMLVSCWSIYDGAFPRDYDNQ